MSTSIAIAPSQTGIVGWVLIVARLILMLVLLLVCAPMHFIWRFTGIGKLFGLRRMWPRLFLAGIGFISGLELRREGQRVYGALLLSNHVSWLDIPALSHAANSAFVAHDGLKDHPFLKWLCDMNDTLFIARHRRTTVTDQRDDVRDAIGEDGTLTLFPEGTTSDGTALLPFKSSLLGALEPLPEGAVVQPVLLAYEDVPEMAWVGEEPGLDNFKRILARTRPLKIVVHFLPPLDGDELTNRKTMTAAAQSAIEQRIADQTAV